MKTILLSDVHLVDENPPGRVDNVVETQWEKLSFVFDYAENNDIDCIVQAGDLTDIKRSWNLVQRLAAFLSKRKIKLYMVKGQHDSYYRDNSNQKTITGVLISSGLIQLLGEEPIIYEASGLRIYGCSYGEEVPVPMKSGCNLLVVHKQIADGKLWDGQTEYEDALDYLKIHIGYNVILCGDAHQQFVRLHRGRIICNTGPLLRLEATETMINHKPCFYVYDTHNNGLQQIFIPCASEVLSRNHIEVKETNKASFTDFINRVKDVSADSNGADFDTVLKGLIARNKTPKSVVQCVNTYILRAEEEG